MSTTEEATPAGETPPVAPPAEPPAEQAPPETGDDLAGELEKWKAMARKNEERAKANADAAAELDKIRKQHESDQERAVREAVDAARTEVAGEFQGRLLEEALRAAAGGVLADSNDAVRLVDHDGLIGSDGMPDRDAIAQRITTLVADKPYLAAQKPTPGQPGGSAEGGSRGASGPDQQLTRDDLQSMSPEDIVKAKADGRLNDLLGAN